MNLQATFTNPSGQAKTLDIKDGLNLQDAYNVVANDDFAPTQITLEATNMNSSDSNVEPDKQVETAYDLIGKHSINDIIDKHKISIDELAVLLEEGTNHELEHTSSYLIAMKIAQDHLYEDLMYYSKLKEAMLARGAVLSMKKPTDKKRDEKDSLVDDDLNNLSIVLPNEKQSEDLYKMSENEMGYVGAPRLALLDGKTVAGGIFLEPENTYTLYDKTITTPLTEYKFDIVIRRKYRGKGYAKLLLDRMLIDFLENFPEAEQIRAELINKKLAKYLVSKYGFTCDSDNDEDITYCYLSRDEALSQVKKRKGKIRFDKGGYVSEDILIDNNIDKIDDIYVFSEDDKPVKSLGQFTFKGFGKYVMQDLAAELYDDYKIRLRSDFAIMLGEDVIKPSIKVAQMKGDKMELLAIIYNAMVTEEMAIAYVYNEDGEMVGKFTDEDEAEEMVNDNDGYYSEVRVEEVTTPETILAMQFDFKKHEMTFISTLLDKENTHKFKYGGKL